MRFLPLLILAMALPALLTPPAVAQTATDPGQEIHSNINFGLRAGYTNWRNISQMHVGAHLKLGEVMPNVHFTPNVEAGLGGDATIITVNGDLAYSFTELVVQPWNLYGGGSLSFNYFNPDTGSSDTDIGLSALLGLERTLANDHELMFEIRLGLLDSPDVKFTLGYTLF